MNKQGWTKAESFGIDVKPAEEGIKWDKAQVQEQNTRMRQVADVVNIGAAYNVVCFICVGCPNAVRVKHQWITT